MGVPPALSLQERKKILRAEMREKRRLNDPETETYFEQLADVFVKNITLTSNSVVASYSPIHHEIDPIALNDALRSRGHKIALPVIIGKGKPLIFRLYSPDDSLLANPMGVFEPTSMAERTTPDVLLIPLLAFDRRRNRLGYGGGYYDRTIKRLRAHKPLLTVGIAYACQEVSEIPVGSNDVPLDRVVTESGVF